MIGAEDGDIGSLESWNTDESDVRMVAEVLVPFVKNRSKGVSAVFAQDEYIEEE
jgi:hypothetical protein